MSEIFHTSGTCILVFKILPSFGSFFNLIMFYGIGIVPSFLKLFQSYKIKELNLTKLVNMVLNILAFLVQLIALIIITVVAFKSYTGFKNDKEAPYLAALALVLVSFRYWLNFAPETLLFHIKSKDLKESFEKDQSVLNVLIFPVKIGIIIGMA